MRKLACVLLVSGCSIAAVRGPGDWTPASGRPLICDSAPVLPVTIDVLAAMFLGIGLGATAVEQGRDNTGAGVAIGAAAVVTAGVLAASAVIGYRRGIECRAVRAWR